MLFALTSLAGGLAPDKAVLVIARGLQGIAGALMAASTLAIITASFAPGPSLNRAIGTWAATNGVGGAAGALLGGIITEFLSWRWILLINPPIGIAAAVVAYRVVAERRRAPDAKFDLAGAVTLTVGQLILVYGVVEAGLAGWSSTKALVPICVGIVLLIAFGLIEDRIAKAPLIPFKQLTKGLRAANNIVLLFSAALFPMWFVSSLYMQQVLGLSPFHTGLVFLPMTIAILLLASRAGKLVSAFGVRTVLGSGLVMMTVGLLLFTKISPSGSAWVYVAIPGRADRRRDRDVDRALHDRRHAGGRRGPGRPRIGPRQHLAPGRRRARAGGADHARDPALQQPDRQRVPGQRGADARLPARLLHRRRAVRARGADDLPRRPGAGSDARARIAPVRAGRRRGAARLRRC